MDEQEKVVEDPTLQTEVVLPGGRRVTVGDLIAEVKIEKRPTTAAVATGELMKELLNGMWEAGGRVGMKAYNLVGDALKAKHERKSAPSVNALIKAGYVAKISGTGKLPFYCITSAGIDFAGIDPELTPDAPVLPSSSEEQEEVADEVIELIEDEA